MHEVKLRCTPTTVVPNCYGGTDLINGKDPSQEKCPKTLHTITGRNPEPPKDKRSEILSPLWLPRTYYKAPHIVSA